MLKKVFLSFAALAGVWLSGAENLLKNPSFESGLDGWEIPPRTKNVLSPKVDTTVFFDGQASLQTPGEPGKVAHFRQKVKLPEGTKELTFAGRIKTAGFPRGWSAAIHVDCYNAKNKRLKQNVKSTAWQKPENDWVLCGACVPVPEGTEYVYFALRMYNANNWKGKPDNSGSAWFDNLQLYAGNVPEILQEKPAAAVSGKKNSDAIKFVEPVRTGGVFQPGENVVIRCEFGKDGGNAVYTITDFFGRKVAEGKVDAKGMISLAAPKKNGYYAVKVTLSGNVYGEKTGSFIVAEHVAAPDPFFVMCHHYMKEEFLPASRALGYGGMTLAIMPYKIEKQPGKYDFTYTDKWLEMIEKLGMKPHGHFSLPGGKSWALPAWQNKLMPQMMKNGYTEEYYAGVRNFVRAVVRRYGAKVDTWAFGGEINLRRRLSPYYEGDYLRKLQILHSEAKAYDQKMLVAALGVAGVGYPKYDYLKYILPKALPYLDIVCPDWYNSPYVYGPGYRPVSEEKAGFREQILDLNKLTNGKILATEEKGYGFGSGIPADHQALKDNAAVAQRGMIIAKALGLKYWIPHYAVAHKEGKSYNMGMWMRNNPRPLLASTAAMARLLANADNAVEIHPSPEIWAYVFRKGGKAVAAVWQSSSKPVIETSLTLPKDAVCYDIMGNPCAFDGTVSNYPVFVESAEKQAQLADRIRNSTFKLPLYAAEYQFASDSEVRLVIRNLAGKDLKMKISCPDAGTKEVTVPAKQQLQAISFPFKNAVKSPYKSAFTIVCNGETRTIPMALNCIPIAKLKNVRLDGTLKAFAGVKPLVMDNASFLFPVDAAPNGLWTGKKDLSVKIYLGYDEKNLYIGTEVTDDQWFFTKTGSMLWSQDAVEISIDPLNNALSDEMKARGYDSDDLDFTFAQSAAGPAAWCHLNPVKAKCGERKDLTPRIVKKDQDVMILEFAIPWEEMGIKPDKGRIFGFNLGVFDRESEVGGTSYNMALSAGTTNGKDPSCYRKFILAGE